MQENELIMRVANLGMEIAELLLTAQMIADRINRGPGGREMALCITKLEEAQHRLDDTLKVFHAKQ